MKKSRIIALSLALIPLFSGCSNGQMLSDMTIVQSMAVDRVGQDTSVTLEYLNLSKSTGATDSISDNITADVSGKGGNLSDSIFSASSSLSKSTFFGQNKVIVFGMEYARHDLSKGMDYLLRSADSRPDVFVAISDTTGEDIVKNKELGARIPAQSLYDLISKLDDDGIGVSVSVYDLLNFYSDPTADMFAPVLHSGKNSVSCTGIAVFRDNEYTLTLDSKQSQGFNYIFGKVKAGTMNVKSDSMGTIGVVVNKSNSKCRVYVVDDNIYFECKIGVKFVLNDIEKGTTVSVGKAQIEQIENLVSKAIYRYCMDAFLACTTAGCDPFLVGRYLSRYDADIYDFYKQDWHRYITTVQPKISVNSRLIQVNDNSMRG
ncbi:MAG: Ger(x)C family spore germination protein [Eubacterium sp.]